MKSLIHRLLVVFSVLLLVETGSAAESADNLIDKGKVFDRKFQANEALPLYLAAEKLEPKNPDLLVRIARQYRYLMTDASETKEKLRRLPHRKRLLLKTRRTLRHSRINGRKPDSPRPTTVKSVGTGEYIPTMVTAGIAMIVWAVITVIGECIEIVRQIETATWIAADTESEGTEMGTAGIGTAAGITMTTDPAVA